MAEGSQGSQGREPKLAHTDFESMTHEQLVAMLESASSEGASQLAGKLGKAASAITKIGDDLMKYTKRLHWQGEGGDAFRDWGAQAASATLYLGEYSEVASRWMGEVAQAIAEAKASMPPASETTEAKADLRSAEKNMAAAQEARNDPDARKVTQNSEADATAAQGRIDAAQAEAVQRMRKLAQTYQYSAQQVNSVEPPTFAPPAKHVDDPAWKHDGYQDVPVHGGGNSASAPSGGAVTSGGTVTPGGQGTTGSTSPAGEPVITPTAPSNPHPTQPAAMGIDGTTTLPDAPPAQGGPPAPSPSGGRPDSTPPPILGTAPPRIGPSLGQSGPTAPPPGRPSPAVRPPLLPPNGGANNGLGNRLPRETGIVGGKPVPPKSGRPTTGIPRSNVFGGDHMQGRTPMSSGTGPATNGMGPGRTGVVGGRRLTGEPGGTIGRQPHQPGRANGRPFTPGGTGLVRGSTSGESPRSAAVGRPAPVPPGAQGNASRRDEKRTDRPDYLSEEEESWQPDHRRIVPPVVD